MYLLFRTPCIFIWILFFSVHIGYAAPIQEASSKAPQTDVINLLDSLYITGSRFLQKRDFSPAQQHFEEGLSIAKKQGDSLYTGRLYNGLGAVALYQNQNGRALEYFHTSLAYINKDRYPDDVAKVFSNMSALYARLKEFEKAKDLLEEALEFVGEKTLIRLNLLANLASLCMDLEDFDRAEALVNETLMLADELGQPMMKAVMLGNLVKRYTDQGRWQEGIKAGEESLKIRDSLGLGSPMITLNNLGYAWQKSGRTDKAEEYYRRALEEAEGEYRLQLLLNLANLARETGDLRGSLRWFDAYNELKDSLAALDYRAKVAELTEKYESDKKQFQIDNLQAEKELQAELINRQKILVVASLALLLLFAGLIYVWIKQNKTRQALEKSRIQQRFLLTQLNPHFIFNALQSVQNFIFKNEKETSVEYLGSFGKLIRSVLESSDRETISLEKEMEMIHNFLHLQQLNSDHSFMFEITEELPEETDAYYIPVMLVQPFVENAVIHGVKGVPEGKIQVGIKNGEAGHMLQVEICDNGRGIDPERKQNADALHRSMGMEIVNKRIREFNKGSERKIHVEITPFREDTDFPGTRVLIDLPILWE
ncbi:tetratricopeptide repeat-containing sensor histidine kinase [Sinomicrobium weinanense]|uniref:Tetratricopeptide repeat protein n=1 Tax=Sinomicrobium weinanense TaxID=2842200 RepID=A0A926JNB9_9FLAO|nr:tetratricopeptide repeat protein [Sinomicrobium weinanense]MBC9794339.1 tetratricopeptide repeat protein [Sinomicrobium weinanense]MBU3124246.1 tetratricopeptide repeat protein [Sinomicrobium weinanense]